MLALLQKYDGILLGVALVIAILLYVHNREGIAVARANLKHYTDSVTVSHTADSIAAVKRDSVSRARVAQMAASEAAAKARAHVNADSATRLLISLDSARTAADSIVAYKGTVAQLGQQVHSLQQALVAADSAIALHEAREADLTAQLQSLNLTNSSLLARLVKVSRPSFTNRTPFRLVEGALATYGAFKALGR